MRLDDPRKTRGLTGLAPHWQPPAPRVIFTVLWRVDDWVIKPVGQARQTVMPTTARIAIQTEFGNVQDVSGLDQSLG